MQAVGMVNDHLPSCFRHHACAQDEVSRRGDSVVASIVAPESTCTFHVIDLTRRTRAYRRASAAESCRAVLESFPFDKEHQQWRVE